MNRAEPFGAGVCAEPVRGTTTVEPLEEATLQLELAPRPDSIRHARRFVSECMGDTADADAVGVAVLLTSELVTNAVAHGGPHAASATVRVSMEHLSGRVRVAVHDSSERPPMVRDGSPTTVGGRGLLLVERLADRWGFEPNASGKVVWFEVVTSLAAKSSVGDPND